MSAANPFQIPSCFKLDIEQRRRERFKKTVVTAVIVSVAVVIGLLIEGCVSERSAANAPEISTQAAVTSTAKPAPEQALPEPQGQPVASQDSPETLPLQSSPVAMVPKTAAPVAPPHTTGATVYLVKSGDTLSRIAKTHGTTIKALKSANNLTSDMINIGQQLKIPSA